MSKTAQEMKIDRLEIENQNLHAQLHDIKKDHDAIAEENECLKRTIEQWREENKKLTNQIRRAKEQIKSALQVLTL